MGEACCGSNPTNVVQVLACPSCGQCGHSVALLTVQAQVAISLRTLAAHGYQFCATQDCPIVYYAANAEPITSDQVRERVFQKEPTGEVLVCYCFRYRVAALQQADQTEQAAILASITAGIQQGQCACELRNPQGRCCLGNVRRVLHAPVPIQA